jgi:hypothetical protein
MSPIDPAEILRAESRSQEEIQEIQDLAEETQFLSAS